MTKKELSDIIDNLQPYERIDTISGKSRVIISKNDSGTFAFFGVNPNDDCISHFTDYIRGLDKAVEYAVMYGFLNADIVVKPLGHDWRWQ